MTRQAVLLMVQQALLLFAALLLARSVSAVISMIIALREGIQVAVSPWGVEFIASQATWLQCNCVVGIYLSGPLVGALLGAGLLVSYPTYKQTFPWLKTFLLWTGLWLVIQLMMGWLGGLVSGGGLGHVANWMYLPPVMLWGLILLLLVAVVALGFRMRRRLFRSLGYSMAMIEKRQSRPDVLAGYGIPMVLLLVCIVLWYSWRSEAFLQAAVIWLGGVLLCSPMWWARAYLAVHAHRFPDRDEATFRLSPVAWVWSLLFIVGIGVLTL